MTKGNRNFWISIILLFIATLYVNFMSHGEKILPCKDLSLFPAVIGKWVGEDSRFQDSVYEKLGVDDSILKIYKEDEKLIWLYVGFYRSQRQGKMIHSPKHCYPGSGWEIVKKDIELIEVNNKPFKVKINKLLIQKGEEKELVFYWYQSRDRLIASEYWQRVYMIWDAILYNRTDGSFVRISVPIVNDDIQETLVYGTNFVEEVIPLLMEYLPQ